MPKPDLRDQATRDAVLLGLMNAMIDTGGDFLEERYPDLDGADKSCCICSAALGVIAMMAAASIKPDKIEEYLSLTVDSLRRAIKIGMKNAN